MSMKEAKSNSYDAIHSPHYDSSMPSSGADEQRSKSAPSRMQAELPSNPTGQMLSEVTGNPGAVEEGEEEDDE